MQSLTDAGVVCFSFVACSVLRGDGVAVRALARVRCTHDSADGGGLALTRRGAARTLGARLCRFS